MAKTHRLQPPNVQNYRKNEQFSALQTLKYSVGTPKTKIAPLHCNELRLFLDPTRNSGKGRYNTPKKYAEAKAFNPPNNCNTKQLDFLGQNILPVLFIMATSRSPDRVEAEGEANGISTFVLAKAIDRKTSDWTNTVFWHLNQGMDGILPLSRFRETLRWAANQWTIRNSIQSC